MSNSLTVAVQHRLQNHGRETCLAYILELPEQRGEVQSEMNIAKDAPLFEGEWK